MKKEHMIYAHTYIDTYLVIDKVSKDLTET